MKNNLQFLEVLKKIFNYGDRLRPVRDWFVLLSTGLVLLVLGVIWNIFLFTQFENAKSTDSTATLPVQENITSSVSQVQTVFQLRAAEEANYQHNYHFVDPSVAGD